MKKPTALGIDIFAGLFTCGVKQAGFEIVGHLEHGEYGVASARLNFPKMDIRVGKDNWDVKRLTGKVDFIYSNPPCAAWSPMRGDTLNGWRDQLERLGYVRDGVEAAIAIRPQAWCWESVPNAWRHGRLFMLELAERLCDAGYHVTVLLQNNQYLGVPQRRERVFLIGHRRPLVWPKLTTITTVDQTLAAMPKKLPDPPVGPKGNDTKIQRNWDRLWRESAHCKGRLYTAFHALGEPPDMPRPLAIVTRLDGSKPAPVMINSFSRLHPREPREFRWHEWLALCGLPYDWKTGCLTSWDAATRELARAVMPPVGRWLGKAVLGGLKLRPLRGEPTIRVVDLRDPEAPREELLWTRGDLPHERIDFAKIEAAREPTGPNAVPHRKRVGYSKPGQKPRSFKGLDNDAKRPKVARASHAPRLGSGFRIRQMLVKNMPTDKILATIHKEFPDSVATGADVSWNKRKLRLQGGQP